MGFFVVVAPRPTPERRAVNELHSGDGGVVVVHAHVVIERASVLLPGADGEVLDVGAGSHRWTVTPDPDLLAQWLPGTAATGPGPHSLMSDVAVEPTVMDAIISVGVKIMAVGGADVVGALTVQECIERAGLDDDEARRLLDAVAAL